MNICIFSREYPLETDWGGIGNYTYYLSHGLVKAGHEVHVIAQSLDVDKEYFDEKVYVHRIAHKIIFHHKELLREFALRLEYSLRVYQKLKEIMRRYRIDIVEAPNFSAEAFVYSLFKKTPLVIRLHTNFLEVIELSQWRKTFDRRLSCLLENVSILKSDLITCSTKKHAEIISRECGSNLRNTEIIPLGVPLPNNGRKTRFDRKKDEFMVLFVGRLERRKGAHILIKSITYVLKEIPNTKFVLIGRDTFVSPEFISFEGEEKYSFKSRLIKYIPLQYQQNVYFLGHLNRSELSAYFQSCDLFVAPSLYESFGFIYIEAMSYGKPVIGCGVGGVSEVIVDGKTGILVPPEDHLQLAEAIIRLLKDAKLRAKMGMNAKKHVENNFTVERMVQKTLVAYKKILENT